VTGLVRGYNPYAVEHLCSRWWELCSFGFYPDAASFAVTEATEIPGGAWPESSEVLVREEHGVLTAGTAS
jgi:hypothetical protein